MKRQFVIASGLAAAILLGGCEPIDNYITEVVSKNKKTQENQAEIKINQINEALVSQSSEIDDLKKELSSLKSTVQFQTYLLETIDQNAASLSEGGGYAIAKTPHGPFIVSIKKIEPYLDGYRVTLEIGNPTHVLMRGGDFQINWGIPWNTKGKNFAEISASQHNKKFSIPRDFPPGAYTAVDFALTPAKPEEVKSISVGITWNTISLRRSGPN